MKRLVVMTAMFVFLAFAGENNAMAYKEITVENSGAIYGKITFNGTPPEPEHFQITKNSDVCGATHDRQTVRVENGTLQDVVVLLEGIEAGKPRTSNMANVIARDCVFKPYLSVVSRTGKGRKGSPYMAVLNEDTVIHNPHPFETQAKGRRTLWNVGLPEKGSQTKKQLIVRKSNTVRLECDQHNFMLSWTRVVDNPYWAISGKDGTFSIDDIPPGSYTMIAWHPMLGEQKQEIMIKKGGSEKAHFTF